MKKIYKILLAGLFLTFVSNSAIAMSETISIVMYNNGNDKEDIDPHNKGHRIPSLSNECTIDFENHHIELSTSEYISSYELWDEDGMSPIVSYPSDYKLVEYMDGLTGVFQLRLITENHTYFGYVEL